MKDKKSNTALGVIKKWSYNPSKIENEVFSRPLSKEDKAILEKYKF